MKYNRIFVFYLFIILIHGSIWPASSYNLEIIIHIDEITIDNTSDNFGVSDVWGYTDETGIEYAIVGYRYGTKIFKIQDDNANYELVADIIGPSNGDYYFHRDYKTYEDFLYVVNEMNGPDVGMQVIDLSPLPDNIPIQLDTYEGIQQSHNLWIDLDSGYGFIEKYYPENIHVVDLSNPAYPNHIASLSYWDAENCHDIYTRNNIAYISEGYSYEFGIYDITDITNPIHLASIPSFGYAHNAWLNESGTHLITGEETVGMTVKIWDIQNLENINLVGEYLGENSLAHNVHVKGDFLYISHYTTGLKIVDIFDPSDPIEVAAYDTYILDDNEGFYGCWGAFPFTSNNYIYASDMQYGLYILEFNEIKAGWIYGTVEEYNQPIPNAQLISTLNNKSYYSNLDGEISFGFPEGNQEFLVFVNGNYVSTENINILAHETIEHNIILGINGDLNADGVSNILDVVILTNQILINDYNNNSDLNQDGFINILDIIQLINFILN